MTVSLRYWTCLWTGERGLSFKLGTSFVLAPNNTSLIAELESLQIGNGILKTAESILHTKTNSMQLFLGTGQFTKVILFLCVVRISYMRPAGIVVTLLHEAVPVASGYNSPLVCLSVCVF